jgi:hypothetical protein
MKVKLRARRLWKAIYINQGTEDEEEDCSAMEAILASVPQEYREPLGAKKTARKLGTPSPPCASALLRKEGEGATAVVAV